jgi:hypothetical protein
MTAITLTEAAANLARSKRVSSRSMVAGYGNDRTASLREPTGAHHSQGSNRFFRRSRRRSSILAFEACIGPPIGDGRRASLQSLDAEVSVESAFGGLTSKAQPKLLSFDPAVTPVHWT